jgi:hypothetical protein
MKNPVLIFAVACRLASIFALLNTVPSVAWSTVQSIVSSIVPSVALSLVVAFDMLPLIDDVEGHLVEETPPAGHLRAPLMLELHQTLSCHLACFPCPLILNIGGRLVQEAP